MSDSRLDGIGDSVGCLPRRDVTPAAGARMGREADLDRALRACASPSDRTRPRGRSDSRMSKSGAMLAPSMQDERAELLSRFKVQAAGCCRSDADGGSMPRSASPR